MSTQVFYSLFKSLEKLGTLAIKVGITGEVGGCYNCREKASKIDKVHLTKKNETRLLVYQGEAYIRLHSFVK